jgi:hypothetical protein
VKVHAKSKIDNTIAPTSAFNVATGHYHYHYHGYCHYHYTFAGRIPVQKIKALNSNGGWVVPKGLEGWAHAELIGKPTPLETTSFTESDGYVLGIT